MKKNIFKKLISFDEINDINILSALYLAIDVEYTGSPNMNAALKVQQKVLGGYSLPIETIDNFA